MGHAPTKGRAWKVPQICSCRYSVLSGSDQGCGVPVQRGNFSFVSFLSWLDKGTWKFPLSFWMCMLFFIVFLFPNIMGCSFVLKLKYCTEATVSREFRNAEHNMLLKLLSRCTEQLNPPLI